MRGSLGERVAEGHPLCLCTIPYHTLNTGRGSKNGGQTERVLVCTTLMYVVDTYYVPTSLAENRRLPFFVASARCDDPTHHRPSCSLYIGQAVMSIKRC
jgi:hypothetical protein